MESEDSLTPDAGEFSLVPLCRAVETSFVLMLHLSLKANWPRA